MNSLYTQGTRQVSSIQADLDRMRGGDASASLQGQISASLAALQRTVEDFDAVARREMIKAKQEKASMRVQKFRTDYNDLRTQFEQIKIQIANEHASAQRSDLLSIGPLSTGDTRRRVVPSATSPTTSNPNSTSPPEPISESPFRDRGAHALREHSFIQHTESQMDQFLAQGREVLDNLVDQRQILRGTQRRLTETATTLGLSRDVIGWIERRSVQDMYIFFAGAVATFVCFYLIWHYFG